MATANDSPGPPYLLRANGVPLTPDGRVLHLELGAGDGEMKLQIAELRSTAHKFLS